MTRFILTLLILTALPISLPAETICVYEIDTAFYYSVDGVDTVKNRILCIDTIPHWIVVGEWADTSTAKSAEERQFRKSVADLNTLALQWLVLKSIPRVDTVTVYIPDTVSLWHRHHADGTTETYDSWLVWPYTVYAGPWDDTIWVSLYAEQSIDTTTDLPNFVVIGPRVDTVIVHDTVYRPAPYMIPPKPEFVPYWFIGKTRTRKDRP